MKYQILQFFVLAKREKKILMSDKVEIENTDMRIIK